MAFKDHKKGITRIFLVMVVMCILCFGVFSCTTYLNQQSKTYVNIGDANLVQLDEPEDDAPAMRIQTTEGNIVAELYPEQAPKYVEQFTQLAESGYYDNTYVFSVEDGVYFEAGTKKADGVVDADAAEKYEHVERETSADLWPLRGAFCVPGTSKEGNLWNRLTGQMTYYCGSRFLVCNSITFDESAKKELESVSDDAEEINAAFLKQGGVPNYSQQMTVFAQAYGDESFATIDAITGAKTKTASGEEDFTPPENDIQILKIEIGTYQDFTSGKN